jgi:hypothetical protein
MTRTSLVYGLIWTDGTAELREAKRLFSPEAIERLKTKLPRLKNAKAEAQFPERIVEWAAGYLKVKHRWEITSRERKTRRQQVAKAAKALTNALRQLDPFDRVSLIENLPRKAVSTPEPASATVSSASWGFTAKEILDSRVPADAHLHRIEDDIVLIEQAATEAAEIALPKAGRPTPVQHSAAVMSLCEIYEATTGLKPRRRLKPKAPGGTSVPYGPLYEFVSGALTPLEGAATAEGTDVRIKRALRARKRT